jgi:hypothetical protein
MNDEIISTTKINIDLRTEYDLRDAFEPDTKIILLRHDTYHAILDLLTPDQLMEIWNDALSGEFMAIRGYVAEKI